MGYNIYIGNAELESSWPTGSEYDNSYPEAKWVVAPLSLGQAPYFSDSDRGNGRDPSYSTWADFCREVGLYDWMLKQHEGKMGQHPGCAALFPSDAEMLTQKLEEYRQQHPNEEATFCECSACDDWGKKDKPPHNPNASPTLARLTWLTWWVNWAVANCERPAIHNT